MKADWFIVPFFDSSSGAWKAASPNKSPAFSSLPRHNSVSFFEPTTLSMGCVLEKRQEVLLVEGTDGNKDDSCSLVLDF